MVEDEVGPVVAALLSKVWHNVHRSVSELGVMLSDRAWVEEPVFVDFHVTKDTSVSVHDVSLGALVKLGSLHVWTGLVVVMVAAQNVVLL